MKWYTPRGVVDVHLQVLHLHPGTHSTFTHQPIYRTSGKWTLEFLGSSMYMNSGVRLPEILLMDWYVPRGIVDVYLHPGTHLKLA